MSSSGVAYGSEEFPITVVLTSYGSLAAEPFTVSVSVPKASERLYIGRAKKLNKGIWLFESESGEYGLVPEQEAQKWYLE